MAATNDPMRKQIRTIPGEPTSPRINAGKEKIPAPMDIPTHIIVPENQVIVLLGSLMRFSFPIIFLKKIFGLEPQLSECLDMKQSNFTSEETAGR
jgi:hypothetical protein